MIKKPTTNSLIVSNPLLPDTTPLPDEAAVLVVMLFEAHHGAVFRYVRQLTRDDDLAHDLTQEAFLTLYQTRHKLSGVENPRAWLYRIASNLAFNALKRRQRWQWLPWHDDNHWLHEPGHAAAFGEKEAVQQALLRLKPEYRAPLILYSQQEMSVREIAAALNLSESNVKVRLHRARAMFLEAYQGNDDA
jgi:RNA polymerase sigma-70 factor (ECF subfamily)